jgi:ABC-type Fe3+-hydroxamate transport system substrate-binding protein
MPSYYDQLGNLIILNHPRRIISLVPSQTELLHYLGLEEEVAGITKFCIHPDLWFREKFKIGGTKNINIERVHQVKPDLVIANKEENDRSQIEELQNYYPVWISDINNLSDAYAMIGSMGSICLKTERAELLIREINLLFADLEKEVLKDIARPATAYLIWRNPYMAAGGNTFIDAMLDSCGLTNIFKSASRYPVISIEELKQKHCELLILSSEPYPFQQKHAEELKRYLPDTKIILADGEMFSWYGNRLLYAPGYFSDLRKRITEN